MNEQERAEWLARALDNLLARDSRPPVSPGLEDEEMASLLRVARARLDQGQAVAHAGLQHEAQVWQEVLARLQRGATTAADPQTSPEETTDAGEVADADDPEPIAEAELDEIVHLRRRMAKDLLAVAEAHRDEVWQRLQFRLEGTRPTQKRGFFTFLRPHQERADALAAALDAVAAGGSAWDPDPEVRELIRIARTRHAFSEMAAGASAAAQDRVWARVRPGLFGDKMAGQGDRRGAVGARWPKIAAAAAAVAVVIAALGPVPATGFAQHPAARAVRSLGRHLGVIETNVSPPAAPGSPTVVSGTEVSAKQAAALMLLPIRVPSVAPTGMHLTSSRFYPKAITAANGGTFVLTYEPDGANESLAVYQEAASGADLTALQGSSIELVLTDGTPATFIAGGWQTADGSFVWDQGDSATLVFERDGVRTIIRGSSGSLPPATLAAIADAMVPAE